MPIRQLSSRRPIEKLAKRACLQSLNGALTRCDNLPTERKSARNNPGSRTVVGEAVICLRLDDLNDARAGLDNLVADASGRAFSQSHRPLNSVNLSDNMVDVTKIRKMKIAKPAATCTTAKEITNWKSAIACGNYSVLRESKHERY